jgi:NADH-quinone oxidoreductase subunit A
MFWYYQLFYLFFFIFGIYLFEFVFVILALFLGINSIYKEKATSYECGFVSFDDSKNLLEAPFFVVIMLFIIFDMELIIILPWAVSIQILGFYGILIMYIFLFFMGLGFYYEYSMGVLL